MEAYGSDIQKNETITKRKTKNHKLLGFDPSKIKWKKYLNILMRTKRKRKITFANAFYV